MYDAITSELFVMSAHSVPPEVAVQSVSQIKTMIKDRCVGNYLINRQGLRENITRKQRQINLLHVQTGENYSWIDFWENDKFPRSSK